MKNIPKRNRYYYTEYFLSISTKFYVKFEINFKNMINF